MSLIQKFSFKLQDNLPEGAIDRRILEIPCDLKYEPGVIGIPTETKVQFLKVGEDSLRINDEIVINLYAKIQPEGLWIAEYALAICANSEELQFVEDYKYIDSLLTIMNGYYLEFHLFVDLLGFKKKEKRI